MMDAAALKVAAENLVLLQLQKDYLRERFREAEGEEEVLKLRKIMTYLRYLPDWRALTEE